MIHVSISWLCANDVPTTKQKVVRFLTNSVRSWSRRVVIGVKITTQPVAPSRIRSNCKDEGESERRAHPTAESSPVERLPARGPVGVYSLGLPRKYNTIQFDTYDTDEEIVGNLELPKCRIKTNIE